MNFTDAVTVAGTRRTNDGYLTAEAFAVRSGVQRYAGFEVGKPELPFVDVYRPESEVKDAASLRTFSHAPVTMDHPSVPVTSDNWKQLAVGEVSTEAEWQNDRIKLPLILKDADAIAAVTGGKRGLSAGYTCQLVFGDGVTPDGKPFQATQTKIRANHLAVVDAGRAGPDFRIGDDADNAGNRTTWGASPIHDHAEPKEVQVTTPLQNMVIGDKSVQVSAADVAVIEAFKADKAAEIQLAADLHDTAIAAKDAELATKDAKIAELEGAALTDDALDARVADRATLIDTAKRLASKVETKGLSDAAIRKAVLTDAWGAEKVAGKSDAYIDAAFDVLADAKPADPLAPAIGRMATTQNDGATKVDDAYQAMLADLGSAHKGGVK